MWFSSSSHLMPLVSALLTTKTVDMVQPVSGEAFFRSSFPEHDNRLFRSPSLPQTRSYEPLRNARGEFTSSCKASWDH